MTVIAGSTPLIALPGVVLDTETTGLDTRSARIVQIGAVRIEANALSPGVFDTLINPGQPIPPAASMIHHITDADVAGAPDLSSVAASLRRFIGDAVVIGHTVSFDLAILEREHARVGQPWTTPRWLDVRGLVRLAVPSIAHDDLDSLCARFAIANPARHSALGDAHATGLLFLALIPRLRAQGIRTLAEAEAVTRRLREREVRPDARDGGGEVPAASPPESRRALIRIDSFPYRHRVRDVMTAPALIAAATDTVSATIAALAESGASSVFVPWRGLPDAPPSQVAEAQRESQGGSHRGSQGAGHGAGPAENQPSAQTWGIVTERDILRALDRHGAAALAHGLAGLASGPLACVGPDDYVYRAIGRMTRLGIRHLGVRAATGELVGALTPRNLLRQRATAAIVLGDQVDCADSAVDLAAAWAHLPAMAEGLLAEAVDPRDIAAVISTELRALTRRAAELADARMSDDGLGPPPVPYCVLVLGSGGRGESLLAADQDNAIVYAEGEPGGTTDQWFAAMARHMNAILDVAGVPFCAGGVMAREAGWRLSLGGWRARVDHWVRRQRPEDLLDVDIFFDLTPVHGDRTLGEAVRDHAFTVGGQAPDFLKLLASQGTQGRAPLSLFGRVRTDESGRVDVKRTGLMPIFTAARMLAIRHGIRERSTQDRLRAIGRLGIGSPRDIETILDAHRVLLEACLRQQLTDAEAGVPLSPRVAPPALPAGLRQALPGAFRAVATAVDLMNEGRVG